MINDLFEPNGIHVKYSIYADDVAFWITHPNEMTAFRV